MSLNTASAIWADKLRLNQVLLNLVTNGIKYNGVNGTLTLTSKAMEDQRLRISVIDTGPGIPEERLNELFEPFSRLGAEQGNIEGTGIGLSICKRLVELMDGELGVESTPDEGSRFWAEFRLTAPV